MQTAVGFVRSLYDNENHYRITWGFRTWEQRGGEGRATLGLINGLWRCPSGPLYGFFFLLFYPLLSFTTPLFIPLFCSPAGQCKSEQACSERLTECKPNSPLWRRKGGETGWGVYDSKQGLCLTWQNLSSHFSEWACRREGSHWPLASGTVGQLRMCVSL